MKKICKIALFALMVVVVLASMTACGKTKLDVADGVTVVFSGADGNGRAELIHDEENPSEMAPKFLLKLVKDKKVAADDWQKLMTIGSAVSYDLDKSSGLSNGDTVTVTISVDKDVLNNLKMTAEPTKLTFTVKGLTEVKTIQPFQNFEITYDGISPNAHVKDYTRSEEIDGATVNYYIDTTSNLREGQEITVTAALKDRTYYKLAEESMTVTVSGVDTYISDISDLQPDTLSAMQKKADAVLKERLDMWASYYSYNGFEYVGHEFFSSKDDSSWRNNYVYLYYRINASQYGADFTSYYYVCFENVIQHHDGTQEVDLEKYDMPLGFLPNLNHYLSLESCSSDIHAKYDQNYDSQQKFE